MINSKDIGNVDGRQYVWDGSTWVPMVQPSTGGGAAGSTQVSVSNFSTQVSIGNQPTVSVSGYVAPSTDMRVSPLSTVWAVQVDGRVRAQNSTISDLLASVQQNSTVWSVQQGGYVAPSTDMRVSPLSTVWAVQVDGRVRAQNSTIGDFLASVQQNSTVWQVQQGGYVAPSTDIRVSPLAGSTWSVRPLQSSQADLRATIYQSTAADLNVTMANFSTAVRVGQSTATDLKTAAWLFDSTGQSLESSTRANAASTMRGLSVRSIQPDCTSASGQAAAAGDNTILSSNSQSIYVYAFSWTPISTAANLVRWLRGSTSECWRARVLAPSTVGSQAWDVSLAVSPPAYLFKTSTGQNLVLNVTSSGVSYSVAAWREG